MAASAKAGAEKAAPEAWREEVTMKTPGQWGTHRLWGDQEPDASSPQSCFRSLNSRLRPSMH